MCQEGLWVGIMATSLRFHSDGSPMPTSISPLPPVLRGSHPSSMGPGPGGRPFSFPEPWKVLRAFGLSNQGMGPLMETYCWRSRGEPCRWSHLGSRALAGRLGRTRQRGTYQCLGWPTPSHFDSFLC